MPFSADEYNSTNFKKKNYLSTGLFPSPGGLIKFIIFAFWVT